MQIRTSVNGYQTRPIRCWEVIEKTVPFGNAEDKLRLYVTYLDGKQRILPPSFKGRAELNKYVGRFHPDFTGKEV